MRYKEAIEIGREEAYELSGYELPTSKKDRLLVRQVGHPQGNEVIFREHKKYYIAPFNEQPTYKG